MPTGISGEVVWTASAAPAAMLSGAVTLADGTTGEVWITRADGAGSALEFGIRFDGRIAAHVVSLYELSAGGRYLLDKSVIPVRSTLTAPGTLVAVVYGAEITAVASLLRQSDVLSYTVSLPSGSITLSVMLGISGAPLLEPVLAAAGV